MSKYIIEIEDDPINDAGTMWKAKNFNSLVFDEIGLSKLEEYEEPAPKWEEKPFPQQDSFYYYIEPDGSISGVHWGGTYEEESALAIGNCFKTQEEAELAVERLKVMHELNQYAEPFNTPWDGRYHYTIGYDARQHTLVTQDWMREKYGNLWFESPNAIEEAIKAVGKDRIKKYYFGVMD